MPTLHYETLGAHPQKWVLMVHGFLGSGRNWVGFCKKWIKNSPQLGMILVDLRLHGNNYSEPGIPLQHPPHTVRQAGKDLFELVQKLNFHIETVVAHSLGGKVSLNLADLNPPGLKKVIILDASPFRVNPQRESTSILHTMRDIPMPQAHRNDVVKELMSAGLSRPIAHWAAMNVVEEGGNYVWKLDFPSLEELLFDYFDLDMGPWLKQNAGRYEFHFVKALQSGFIDLAQMVEIPDIHLHQVDGDHWLHITAEAELINLLTEIV